MVWWGGHLPKEGQNMIEFSKPWESNGKSPANERQWIYQLSDLYEVCILQQHVCVILFASAAYCGVSCPSSLFSELPWQFTWFPPQKFHLPPCQSCSLSNGQISLFLSLKRQRSCTEQPSAFKDASSKMLEMWVNRVQCSDAEVRGSFAVSMSQTGKSKRNQRESNLAVPWLKWVWVPHDAEMISLYTGLSDTWMIGLRRSIKLVVHLQQSLGCNAAVIVCDMFELISYYLWKIPWLRWWFATFPRSTDRMNWSLRSRKLGSPSRSFPSFSFKRGRWHHYWFFIVSFLGGFLTWTYTIHACIWWW